MTSTHNLMFFPNHLLTIPLGITTRCKSLTHWLKNPEVFLPMSDTMPVLIRVLKPVDQCKELAENLQEMFIPPEQVSSSRIACWSVKVTTPSVDPIALLGPRYALI